MGFRAHARRSRFINLDLSKYLIVLSVKFQFASRKSAMALPFPAPHDSPDDVLLEMESEPENTTAISISTTFYPREDYPCDLVIVTEDSVFFSVNKHVLLSNSQNFFGGFLLHKETNCMMVPESADVLNLVLHAFYNFDPTYYKPTLYSISGMLAVLPRYGLPVALPLAPGKPIHNFMLGAALSSPLEVYTLAAQHQLEHLAVEASQHLLAMPLHNLTDDHCLRMGAVYLRRLMFLHLGRTERLKGLLRDPPTGHNPTKKCETIDQKRKLDQAWKKGLEELCWELNACTPVSLLLAILHPIVGGLTCEECKTSTRERIQKLIADWTMVKATI